MPVHDIANLIIVTFLPVFCFSRSCPQPWWLSPGADPTDSTLGEGIYVLRDEIAMGGSQYVTVAANGVPCSASCFFGWLLVLAAAAWARQV